MGVSLAPLLIGKHEPEKRIVIPQRWFIRQGNRRADPSKRSGCSIFSGGAGSGGDKVGKGHSASGMVKADFSGLFPRARDLIITDKANGSACRLRICGYLWRCHDPSCGNRTVKWLFALDRAFGKTSVGLLVVGQRGALIEQAAGSDTAFEVRVKDRR